MKTRFLITAAVIIAAIMAYIMFAPKGESVPTGNSTPATQQQSDF